MCALRRRNNLRFFSYRHHSAQRPASSLLRAARRPAAVVHDRAALPGGLLLARGASCRDGAALFACTNAAATALYRRGGASVVSLYVIRSPIVFAANVAIVALQEGTLAATNVLLLRTGSATATRLALTRSLLNSLKQILLSVAFVYLTYADNILSLTPNPSPSPNPNPNPSPSPSPNP